MYRRAKARLDDKSIDIVMPLVGRYATSMEMTGATITLCKLDGELEGLLKAPCHCAFWTVA
jgi:dihydroxyacetone kinase-like protein